VITEKTDSVGNGDAVTVTGMSVAVGTGVDGTRVGVGTEVSVDAFCLLQATRNMRSMIQKYPADLLLIDDLPADLNP